MKPIHSLLAACAALTLVSCGGSGNERSGNATASRADRARIQAATTTLAVALPQDADPLMQGLTIPADAVTRGMWSATQTWPMNGLHAVLLPNGKVLTYGTPLNTPGTQDGRTYDIWTPSLGFGTAAHATSFEAGRFNSFCSTAAWLNDGRLMVTGGNSAVNSVLMTPATGATVNDGLALADQRWYATMLTLPDGRAIILGGMDPYNEGMVDNPDTAIANGTVSMTPEVYTPGTGWTSLAGARSRDAFGPDYLRASYPRAWVAPDGKVFGISAETMWKLDVAGNNGTGAVTVLGKFKTPASTTAPVNVGATNSAVMFAPGKVLQAGGNGYFNGDGYPASNMATVIDINGASPVLTETAPMANARRYINLVVLPDGKVLATGGTKVGNNGGADAVYAAEIWNPATGTWTAGASAAHIRVYHSATLLLPNGTVLSTGGGAPGPVNNQNAEVYYPPYLFRTVNGAAQLAPRPVMTGISALAFAHGAALHAEMADAATMARLVLVGNGAVTHSFNSGQRFVELAFTQAGDKLSATLPASTATVPPGYYQLIALDAQGVPSRAVIVSIGLNVTPTPPVPTLPRNQTVLFENASLAGQAVATDANGLGVLAAGSATSAPTATRFIVRDGLADATCVSLEPVSAPGRWLRHYAYRLQLGTNDNSALFAADATFCPEAGLSGTGLTLRSKNYPGHVLRHRNGEIWIDPQAADAAFQQSASWLPRSLNAALPAIGSLPAAPLPAGGTASWAPGLEATGLSFAWDFGDGSSSAYADSSSATHAYANPGLYTVSFSVRASDGSTAVKTFVQAVYAAPTANAPRASSPVLLDPRSGANARLWVVNADNDSVSVFDSVAGNKLKEIATGAAPRSIARAADGSLWVTNRDAATISVIDAATLAVARTVTLPRASQPFGLVVAADGKAYLTLEASGQLLKLDGSSGATLATLPVGARPRHLAVSGDSARVLVSRFITPPLAGESTAAVDTASGGGEVLAVNTATMSGASTVLLRHGNKADSEIQGRGLPNYLGAAAISPDGTHAWVPSKQDNIARGTQRDGLALNFQNTVRAISSRIELGTLAESLALRVDHDNASLASAAAFDPTGSYLFVALETSRQVAVVDPRRGAELFRIEAGLAPQGLVVSADGTRLFIHNFMARSVTVADISPLTQNGELRASAAATLASVATEKLSATVLKGKQLFYDARDPRLARDAYMSCATCHNDGGHDGRVWDLTAQGEGLRNTISLRGRAGMGQGRLHWSNNFDEVQDFEGQIRALAGGTGLMTDAQFNTGTRSQPLGDAKAGVSADLDALAAYVASLTTFDPSPLRPSATTLSAAATTGKALFTSNNCGFCHSGTAFTRSGVDNPANVGTLKATSGKRLNGTLASIDVPTLRDVWATAPYLHDGSAATLEAAIGAHAGLTATAAEITSLAAYLRETGGDEGAAPTPATTGAGLLGSYYAGTALAGTPLAQRIEAVNFNWGNAIPAVGVPADGFSARWTGTITIPTTGTYRFRTLSDDGVRLWVNGTQRINNWTNHGTTTDTSGAFSLIAGRRSITLEYFDSGGGAVIQLQWLKPGTTTYVAMPASALNAN